MISISSSDSEENDIDVLSMSRKEREKLFPTILPSRSKDKYIKRYNDFIFWKNKNKFKSFSEKVFLAYFTELSKTRKPTTLWAAYSMLKATIYKKHNVDIKDYTRTIALLRRLSIGYKSKKSKILSAVEIERFIKDAPDEVYLATKVALIFGISGACSSLELVNLTVDDVEKLDNLLLVKLPNSCTKIERTFIVRSQYIETVNKYEALRPSNVKTKRYFLNYQRGKCTVQVIGKNKLSGMPKEIATYLELPNPELYTGFCFRRTSAYLFPDIGASMRRREGWTFKWNEKCNKNAETTNNTSTPAQLSTKAMSMQQSSPDNEVVKSSEYGDDDGNVSDSSSLKQTDSQTAETPTGFKCRSCEDEIFGFRYVCVECAEYNICINCEALSDHPTHYMLRIPVGKSQAEAKTVLERIRNELLFQQTNKDIQEQRNSLAPEHIDNHKQEDISDKLLVEIIKHEYEDPLCILPVDFSSVMDQDSVHGHDVSHAQTELDIDTGPERKPSTKIDCIKTKPTAEKTSDIDHHEAENMVTNQPKKKMKKATYSEEENEEYVTDFFNNVKQSTSVENIILTPSSDGENESKIGLDKWLKR